MRAHILAIVVLSSSLAAARVARADTQPQPEDPVPPDAVRTIVDIQSTVNDIESTVEPMVADVRDTSVRVDVVSRKEVHIALSADVLFDFDHAELKPEAAPTLEKVLAAMRDVPGRVSVQVDGYTDSVGGDDYNRALSIRRAQAVHGALAKRAARGATFHVGGYGAANPVAPNKKTDGSDDPQGRARNRRVEIVVKAA